MCLFGKYIRNPKYEDFTTATMHVDGFIRTKCGRCTECLKQRSNEWTKRLTEDFKCSAYKGDNVVFCTFTVSPKYYNMVKSDPKRAIRLFLERYRKLVGKSVRHWITVELGEKTKRLHFHALVWNPKSNNMLRKCWQYGFCSFKKCTLRRAAYVAKYLSKGSDVNLMFKPFVCTSAGIGKCYVEDLRNIHYHRNGSLKPFYCENGYHKSLPRYYRLKLFTDDERSAMNIHACWLRFFKGEEFWLCGKPYKNYRQWLQDSIQYIKLKYNPI